MSQSLVTIKFWNLTVSVSHDITADLTNTNTREGLSNIRWTSWIWEKPSVILPPSSPSSSASHSSCPLFLSSSITHWLTSAHCSFSSSHIASSSTHPLFFFHYTQCRWERYMYVFVAVKNQLLADGLHYFSLFFLCFRRF